MILRRLRFLPFVLVPILFRARSVEAQETDASSPVAPAAPAPSPASNLAPPSAPNDGSPRPPAVAPISQPPSIGPAPRPTYDGMPAPATAAGSTPWGFAVHPGLEIFAQYAYAVTYAAGGGSSWFHAFSLPRAHGSLDGALGPVRARLLLEAVSSANDGALIGVAGDSIVFRVREAYAAWQPIRGLEGAAGVVPTYTIGELDGSWMLRAVAPSTLETSGLASPADVGATLRYTAPRHYGWVGVGVYNGEGYTSPELNRGKNVEVAAEVHPLPGGVLLPLAVFVSYVGGSSGTDSARADRFTGALLWQGKRVRAGAAVTVALGVQDDSKQDALVADAFARVEPIDRLLLGARFSYWSRNTTAPSADVVTTLLGSVGWRIADPLEVHVVVSRALPASLTRSELAGSDYLEVAAVTRVLF